MMKKYAELIVRSGANIQKNQEVLVYALVEQAEFVRLVVESAYEAGAKEVIVSFSDERITRLGFEHSPMEVFENVHPWRADMENYHARRGAALISLTGGNPDLLAGVDPRKPTIRSRVMYSATKEFHDLLDSNKNSWCIAGVPTEKWAAKVFPNKENAVELLWEAVFKSVRVDKDDPIKAWEEHHNTFKKKIGWLNEKQFTQLHYKNSLGTDIIIGMPENHIWNGGGDTLQNGLNYFPNMPTEEIFCTPHKDKVNGTVKSAMPLNYQGNLIDKFSLTFKEGVVVDFSAETGYETLKALLDLDEGARRLGEVALIPADSPLSNMNILFYNTLFDENASCHFAIGRGFPSCIADGINMTDEQLAMMGMNESNTHVDFMLGTNDLEIIGIDKQGNASPIFKNGNWAF